ncbi:related to MRPL32 - mitochondrial ribosomal protein of the large subunit [Ustilago sp. UG-2017a]|nr:related to MRPL32 - mitochondrial ribosomal protein of the large subunit [Ustilago sp. UG-2017a]
MLPTTSTRAAATQLQLTLRLGSFALLRFRLPTILTPSSFSSSLSAPTSSTLTLALATASPTSSPSPSSSSSGWGLGLLWDGILLAVPKKKVSHSRKSMRAANKGLKDRVDLVHCSACGKPKIQHHICAYCYAELNRARKVALRAEEGGSGGAAVQATKGQQKSLNPHQ